MIRCRWIQQQQQQQQRQEQQRYNRKPFLLLLMSFLSVIIVSTTCLTVVILNVTDCIKFFNVSNNNKGDSISSKFDTNRYLLKNVSSLLTSTPTLSSSSSLRGGGVLGGGSNNISSSVTLTTTTTTTSTIRPERRPAVMLSAQHQSPIQELESDKNNNNNNNNTHNIATRATKKKNAEREFPFLRHQQQQQQQRQPRHQELYRQPPSAGVLPRYLEHLSTLPDIPKIVHVTFTNASQLPELIDEFPLLQNNVVGQVLRQEYNHDWSLRLYERDDLLRLFNDAARDGLIPVDELPLLQNAHIVELTDIARILLMYTVGGIYIDLDRIVNIPLDEIISPTNSTRLMLVTNKDQHFMQDVMISSPGNNLYKLVLERMSHRRLHGHADGSGQPLQRIGGWLSRESLYSLGGPIYMNTLEEVLFGRRSRSDDGEEEEDEASQQRHNKLLDIPASRDKIKESSHGLIKVGRYDFCDGDLTRDFDGCREIRRNNLYRHFNITGWVADSTKRWTKSTKI
jgi:Glycosyltransferase sugar-binding region containing DXD motif